MKREEMLKIEHYFEAFLLLFLLGLFLYILNSYIVVLILASSLVFLLYPTYKKLLLKGFSKDFSASLLLVLVLILLLLPTYLITMNVLSQGTVLLTQDPNSYLSSINISSCHLSICSSIQENLNNVENIVQFAYTNFGTYISSYLTSLITSLSKFVMDLFIFMFAFYFLLREGDSFVVYVKKIIPLNTEYKNALFLRIKEVSLAVFVGTLLVAFMQGALLYIGFLIANLLGAQIYAPLFFSIIATFFALIPVIGTPIVWIPIVVIIFLSHQYIAGIFLVLYSAIIVGLSDNFVKPLLIKKKIQVHSFLIFISILGAIQVFGFSGIFLGPMIVALLISVLQLYKLDFR